MLEHVLVYLKVFGISEEHMVEASTGKGLRICDSIHSAWQDFTKEDVLLQDVNKLKEKGYELIRMPYGDFVEIFRNRYEVLDSGVSLVVA